MYSQGMNNELTGIENALNAVKKIRDKCKTQEEFITAFIDFYRQEQNKEIQQELVDYFSGYRRKLDMLMRDLGLCTQNNKDFMNYFDVIFLRYAKHYYDVWLEDEYYK